MKLKVSLICCLFFFVSSVYAQNGNGEQETKFDEDKFFYFTAVSRNKPLNLKQSAKDGVVYTKVKKWAPGTVLMFDGTRVEGLLHHDIVRDLVKVQVGGALQAFSAYEVLNYEIDKESKPFLQNGFDTRREKVVYSSFAYPKSTSERRKLFQVLVSGNMSLLIREEVSPRRPYGKLYLMNSTGRITRVKKKVDQIMASFDVNHAELKDIIKSEQLDMSDIGDVIRLVEAYNELRSQ